MKGFIALVIFAGAAVLPVETGLSTVYSGHKKNRSDKSILLVQTNSAQELKEPAIEGNPLKDIVLGSMILACGLSVIKVLSK